MLQNGKISARYLHKNIRKTAVLTYGERRVYLRKIAQTFEKDRSGTGTVGRCSRCLLFFRAVRNAGEWVHQKVVGYFGTRSVRDWIINTSATSATLGAAGVADTGKRMRARTGPLRPAVKTERMPPNYTDNRNRSGSLQTAISIRKTRPYFEWIRILPRHDDTMTIGPTEESRVANYLSCAQIRALQSHQSELWRQ